jgi:hypothetical protein
VSTPSAVVVGPGLAHNGDCPRLALRRVGGAPYSLELTAEEAGFVELALARKPHEELGVFISNEPRQATLRS